MKDVPAWLWVIAVIVGAWLLWNAAAEIRAAKKEAEEYREKRANDA